MRAMPLRQRVRPVAAVVTLLVVGVGASGCGDDAAETPATTTTTPRAAATSTTSTTRASSTTTVASGATTTVAGTAAPGGTTTTAVATPSGDLVPDGTSFGYVTAINIGGRTVTIDIAELLTGDAAVKAAIEDGVLEPGETSIDNDYYVRNKNPKLRTAPVAPTAPVNVLADPGSPDLSSGSLQELALSLSKVTSDDGPRLPVQIVASGGIVTRIDEVFFP